MGPAQRSGAASGRSGERSSADRIEALLREKLAAEHVEVIDESHLHVGHAGAASGGGHFRAVIVSERFEGVSRLQAQRLVYGALGDEMGAGIHAFSMTTLSPAQWRERADRVVGS